MEVQLEQSEKKVKDLTSQNERLQTELDQLRVSMLELPIECLWYCH